MKINSREVQMGEKRVVVRFAWLPVRTDTNTLVWLERYELTQQLSWVPGYFGDWVKQWLAVGTRAMS